MLVQQSIIAREEVLVQQSTIAGLGYIVLVRKSTIGAQEML